MSYGPDQTEPYKRIAAMVDKILKGTKPTDIPVEQPMKFEFVINLKTAKQIGIEMLQSVLYRADKVMLACVDASEHFESNQLDGYDFSLCNGENERS